jgi:hypothetical protein
MPPRTFPLALAAALAWAAGAAGADLSKVDRAIRKEPAYQGKPRYCLLVFGPEAKHRVWLVLDGDTVYVDRNGDGDLTGEGERVKLPAMKGSDHPAHEQERTAELGDLKAGGLTHKGLQLSQTVYRKKVPPGTRDAKTWQDYLDEVRAKVPDGVTFMVSVKLDSRIYKAFAAGKAVAVLHFAGLDEGHLAFASTPKQAPVVHFGGELTMRLHARDKLQLPEGSDRVTVYVGTRGLGAGAFAHMSHDLAPKGKHPELEVTFPAKEGGGAVTRSYRLKERC